jgi:hypothetical protein
LSVGGIERDAVGNDGEGLALAVQLEGDVEANSSADRSKGWKFG